MVFKTFIPTLWFLVMSSSIDCTFHFLSQRDITTVFRLVTESNMIEVLFLFILHKKIELFRLFETGSTYHDLQAQVPCLKARNLYQTVWYVTSQVTHIKQPIEFDPLPLCGTFAVVLVLRPTVSLGRKPIHAEQMQTSDDNFFIY